MASIERRLQALEGRTEDAERVQVRIFDAAGRELGRDGKPTGRTLAECAPDPEAVHVRMALSDRQAENWYADLDPQAL